MFDTQMGTPSTLSAPLRKVCSATHHHHHHHHGRGFHVVTPLPGVRLQQTDSFCHFIPHCRFSPALRADRELGKASTSVSHPTDTRDHTRACKIHRGALQSAEITHAFQRTKVGLQLFMNPGNYSSILLNHCKTNDFKRHDFKSSF